MEGRKIRLFVAGCVLLLMGSIWFLLLDYMCHGRSEIYISPDSGIYQEGIAVEISMPSGKETLYYTIDGKEPSEDGSNVIEYTEPFFLYADPEKSTYHIRFFSRLWNGTFLEREERNYLILEEGRYPETDYVVCVQGDEDELFGYEEGIFVRGRRWDEYMAENPDANPQHVHIPANYYEDKEVGVHASIFDRDGNEVIAQECGIKIYGSAARVKNQKSFKLIARSSYDQVNEFAYPFFDQLISDNTGENVQAYQRLSLHNSGQDNGYSFVRNTLCNELALQSGFPDVLVSRSASVYINGYYQGVYWLQNSYDDRYFSEKYGSYQGEMVICENTMNQMVVSDIQEPMEREAAEQYNGFCSWLRGTDINDDQVWKRVVETIDVDNLIHYAAIEYYINNYDWPGNVKAYRYITGEGEEYREGTVFDGRYRYLLYDLDYGMGLIFFGWIGSDENTEILRDLCNPDYNLLFASLMQRKECRDAFINHVVNLGNVSFSPESVSRELEQLNESRWNELEYMMNQTDILKGSVWESDDNSIENVKEELQVIQRFAENRRAKVLTEMMYTWDCGRLFQAEAEKSEAGEVCINGQPIVTDSWYFGGIPMELTVKTGVGVEVRGYNVNGIYLEGSEVEILADDYLGDNEKLTIIPEYEFVEKEQLSVRSFSCRGTQDRVVLENTGSTGIHLEDYFVSDDFDTPFRERLPEAVLEPGECFTVYGIKYKGEMEEGSFQVFFSWAKEEPVILSHVEKGVVDCRNRPLK